MKKKYKIITGVLVLITFVLSIISSSYNLLKANKVYEVYLDGELIGKITDKNRLYQLIDEKQENIKNKYNVKNIYPPNGLKIIENYEYDSNVSDVNTIYNKIESMENFTIKGYEIKIGAIDSHPEYVLYTLDKNVFYDAMKKFVLAFVPEEDYNNYLEGNIKDLEDVGSVYDDFNFKEEITIRDKYISVNDKIYESSEEMAKTLIFGFDYNEKSYRVKAGDTVESISEDNEINTKEFLIANNKYNSEDSLLVIGDEVKIAYVTPIINFEYRVREIRKVEYVYDTVGGKDESKPYGEILLAGVTGLSLQTLEYTVNNGEPNSDTKILKDDKIRETVNQVVNKYRKDTYYNPTVYIGEWGWPTRTPYVISSKFGYRSLGGGKLHQGLDISGALWGTEIYAAGDGTVVAINTNCPNNGSYPNSCGGGYGNYVYIEHDSNIYTVYAHVMNNIKVNVGDKVTKGQVIAYMGNSGQSTGTHLHFGYSIGYPSKGVYKNPLTLYSRR